AGRRYLAPVDHSDLTQFRPIVFERDIIDLKNYLNEPKADLYTDVELDEENDRYLIDKSLADLLQELNDPLIANSPSCGAFQTASTSAYTKIPRRLLRSFHRSCQRAVESRLAGKQMHADSEVVRVFDDALTSFGALPTACSVQPSTGRPLLRPYSAAPLRVPVGVLIPRVVMFERRLSDLTASLFNQIRTCCRLDTGGVVATGAGANSTEQTAPPPRKPAGAGGPRLSARALSAAHRWRRAPCRRRRRPPAAAVVGAGARLVLTALDEAGGSVLSLAGRISACCTSAAVGRRLPLSSPGTTWPRGAAGSRQSSVRWAEQRLAGLESMFHASPRCAVRPAGRGRRRRRPTCRRNSGLADLLDAEFDRLEAKFVASPCRTRSPTSACRAAASRTSKSRTCFAGRCRPRRDARPNRRRRPPVSSSVWLLMKQEVRLLIHEASFDGYFVNYWPTRRRERRAARYLSSDDLRKSLHFTNGRLFPGTWHGVSKPVSTVSSADDVSSRTRLMPTQKLMYSIEGETGGSVTSGGRSAGQFLQRAQSSGSCRVICTCPTACPELNNLVLFSYDWLYYKSAALAWRRRCEIFQLVPSNTEVSLVEETIRKAFDILGENLNNLAAELSGSLVLYSHEYKNIKNLVRPGGCARCQHNIFALLFLCQTARQRAPIYRRMPVQSAVDAPELRNGYALREIEGRCVPVQVRSGTGHHAGARLARPAESCTCQLTSGTPMVDNRKREPSQGSPLLGWLLCRHILPLNWIDTMPFEERAFPHHQSRVARRLVACIVASRMSSVIIADLAPASPFTGVQTGPACGAVLVVRDRQRSPDICVDLLAVPKRLMFTRDGSRAFIMCEGEKVMSFKIMFENSLGDDRLQDMRGVAGGAAAVGSRPRRTCWCTSSAGTPLWRNNPASSGNSGRIQKCPTPITSGSNFSEADFAFGDRVVITSIFRDVLVWEVEQGRPLDAARANGDSDTPADRAAWLSLIEHSREIHLWSLQGAFTDGTASTRSLRQFEPSDLLVGVPRAVACCDNSDEMGRWRCGGLRHILLRRLRRGIRGAVATRTPPTSSGRCRASNSFRIRQRPGHLLPCRHSSDVYIVDQAEVAFKQPDLDCARAYYIEPCLFTWNTGTGQTRLIGPQHAVRLRPGAPHSGCAALSRRQRRGWQRRCRGVQEEEEALDSVHVDSTPAWRRIFCRPARDPDRLSFSPLRRVLRRRRQLPVTRWPPDCRCAAPLRPASSSAASPSPDSLMLFQPWPPGARLPRARVRPGWRAGRASRSSRVEARSDGSVLVACQSGNIFAYRLVDSPSERRRPGGRAGDPIARAARPGADSILDRLIGSSPATSDGGGGDGGGDYSRRASKAAAANAEARYRRFGRLRQRSGADEYRRSKSETDAVELNRARSCSVM
uniref:Bromo domain-containing protein n=1 Tax=Macrostomum lignano TaxID=282301 RepID=A0A1I8JNC8_9PLAT